MGAAVTVTCSTEQACLVLPDGPVGRRRRQVLVGAEVRIGCAMDAVYGRPSCFRKCIRAGNAASTAMPFIGGPGGSAQPVMYAPNGNVLSVCRPTSSFRPQSRRLGGHYGGRSLAVCADPEWSSAALPARLLLLQSAIYLLVTTTEHPITPATIPSAANVTVTWRHPARFRELKPLR
ncbi:MAG: hypothetical protein IPM98_13745 [Lewinellaceae bacterium]|nr:hypothetical protein [Lewinellaceae bacterium]